MCLFKDKNFHPHNRPLIAERDIPCYKKLQQVKKDIYITPILDIKVPIECIQDKVPFKAIIFDKLSFIWRHVFGFSVLVEDGFIHSFQKDDEYRMYDVFKCIIPKGTKYFVGREGDYASERIIFLEKVK